MQFVRQKDQEKGIDEWRLYDDEKAIKIYSTWYEVLEEIIRKQIQPTILFYQ